MPTREPRTDGTLLDYIAFVGEQSGPAFTAYDTAVRVVADWQRFETGLRQNRDLVFPAVLRLLQEGHPAYAARLDRGDEALAVAERQRDEAEFKVFSGTRPADAVEALAQQETRTRLFGLDLAKRVARIGALDLDRAEDQRILLAVVNDPSRDLLPPDLREKIALKFLAQRDPSGFARWEELKRQCATAREALVEARSYISQSLAFSNLQWSQRMTDEKKRAALFRARVPQG